MDAFWNSNMPILFMIFAVYKKLDLLSTLPYLNPYQVAIRRKISMLTKRSAHDVFIELEAITYFRSWMSSNHINL